MQPVTTLSIYKYKAGYEVREELFDGKEFEVEDFILKSAYTPNGDYIGDPKWAYRLCQERGIQSEVIPGNKVCTIGFCEREQKWYGWSHRAIYGFGVGSTCEKGDCHYVPSSLEEVIEDAIRFWSGENHKNTRVERMGEVEGIKGFFVEWDCPEEEQQGYLTSVFAPIPTKFGKGKWTAKTLDDAKQMAIDFAKSVS